MENNEKGKVKKIEDMRYEEITETIKKSLAMMRGYVEEVSKAIEKYLEALDKKYLDMINAKTIKEKQEEKQEVSKKEKEEKKEKVVESKKDKEEKPKQRYKQITF